MPDRIILQRDCQLIPPCRFMMPLSTRHFKGRQAIRRRYQERRLRKVIDQRVSSISEMLCSHSYRISPLR